MNLKAKLRVIQAKFRVWFQWGRTQDNQKEKQGKDTKKTLINYFVTSTDAIFGSF